jgi:signal transduction histidine kinase
MTLAGRTGDHEVVTPRLFVVVGVATAAYCLAELATLATPTTVPPPVPLLGVTAVAHVAIGYWLSTGSFTPGAVWRVGAAAATAGVVAVTTGGVVVPPLLGGLPSFETALFLLVATGTDGALVGAVGAALWLPSVPVGRTDEQMLVPETVGDGGRVVHDPVGSRERLVTLHSLVRHNVRNRVNVIGGRLDLLVSELEAADGIDEVDDTHETAIDGQLRAITALLSDIKLAVEALDEDHEDESVPLASVVSEQATVAEQSHDGLSVTVDVDPALCVCADELLSAVVENLLSNAVTHHDRETAGVVVTAESDGEWVRLRVADDGPGIPDRRKKQVFEPEVGEGTGMGLYLVETLVDQYGGDVRLADNDPRGTVVELTLPRAGGEERRQPSRETVAEQ